MSPLVLLFVLAAASAAPQFQQQAARPSARELSREYQSDEAGQYTLRVLLDDGTLFQETAFLKPNAKGDDYVLVKEGTYGHNTPEGKFVQISYVADELGYRPVGDAIPQSVPATF